MPSATIESLSDKPSLTTDKGLARAQEILMAAREIFVAEGYAGLSMRGVASKLNISLSTVQHYYKSKEILVEALLGYIIDGYQQRIEALVQSMTQHSQLQRFMATVDMLLAELEKPDVYSIFTEVWALAHRMPFAAQLIESIQTRERKEIYKLILGLEPAIPSEEYKVRAALIIIQIHGFMIHFPHSGSIYSRQHMKEAIRQSLLKLATHP